MKFNKLKKRVIAGVISAAVAVSAFSVPAEAAGLGDILGIGASIASYAAQREQVDKQLKFMNTTPEGQEQLFEYFKQQRGVNDNPAYTQKMDRIMNNLLTAVNEVDPDNENKLPYRYFVTQDMSVNAACAMGHVMMVNTGTFDHLPTEDEVAAVVGHELGHGQKNHAIKGIKSQINNQLLARVGSAAMGSTALANIVGNLALVQANSHGDKGKEWEADKLSFEYITRTNYNPGACAAVMQRFIELYGAQKQSGTDLIFNPSDHPNSEARRDKYLKLLHEYSGKKVSMKDGEVKVDGKKFVTPVAAGGLSQMARSCFVLGNLASAYKHGQGKEEAYAKNGTVMLGNQPILTPVAGDETAEVLAARLNEIRKIAK